MFVQNLDSIHPYNKINCIVLKKKQQKTKTMFQIVSIVILNDGEWSFILWKKRWFTL